MYESERKGGESVANGKYDHIIHMTHHVSEKHPRLDVSSYAAQFSPFAALTGYDDLIVETARFTEKRMVPDESELEILNRKMLAVAARIGEQPEVTLTYFEPDALKDGGKYVRKKARVKSVRPEDGVIVLADGSLLPIEDIADIQADFLRDASASWPDEA